MNQNVWQIWISTVWISPISTKPFFDSALVLPSHNKRWRGIGKTIRGVVVVVFVTLGKEAVSVISMRPVSRSERRLYAEY